jgi:heptosyltransferase III
LPCFIISNALVLRGGALGDFILTLPIVHELERKFSTVNLVANRMFADLGVNLEFALDDLDLAPFFVAEAQLPLRWSEYFRKQDLVLSYLHDPGGIFEQNVRACGVETFVVGPHRFQMGLHATEQLARPLAAFGITFSDFRPRIEFSAAERKAMCEKRGQAVIALHPGSGSARKNWPIENWITLIDDLLTTSRHQRVLVVGGEADEKEITRIRARFGDRVDYALNWPLRRLAALLSDAKFVGHDSGISHLAAAAGARCFVLFGATDPRIWAPQNENVRLLIAPGKDLQRLTVAEVRRVMALS